MRGEIAEMQISSTPPDDRVGLSGQKVSQRLTQQGLLDYEQANPSEVQD
jgi:hypothetical protein